MKKISNDIYKTLKEMDYIKFIKIKNLIIIYKDVYNTHFKEIVLGLFFGVILILLTPIQLLLFILERLPKIFFISKNTTNKPKESISRKIQKIISDIYSFFI